MRLHDECLNREQVHTLTEPRVVIEHRRKYNHERMRSTLGYENP